MKPGKLSPSELSTYVFPRHGVRRADVLVRAGIGQDSAVVDFGAEVAVLSTDPITGAGKNAGWLAVHVGCNDVAATGARPVGVLVALLLAPSTAISDADEIMADAHRAAAELGIEIIGGHSEITADLQRSLVVVTALGRVLRGGYVTSNGAHTGDTILLSKSVGLEGAAILATELADVLADHVSAAALARARTEIDRISVVPEALAAAEVGATAMHDVTEGGLLGALAELAAAAELGVDVNLDLVPILAETKAICSALAIDPFCLVSSGALLITTSQPHRVLPAVRSIGCPVAEIGRMVAGASRIRQGGVARELVPPHRDALWDALERGKRAAT